MMERGPRWILGVMLALTFGLAFFARVSYDVNRSEDPRSGEWVSLEPDSFYHMRRAQRVLSEGWPVAGSDPNLDYPDGAEIPWPPYYSGLLALMGEFVVEDPNSPEGRLTLEQLVARVPLFFGCLTALLAALAAYRLAGNRAAACAGASTALALGAVLYSGMGNGDHHAFVAFLHLALLAGLSWGLEARVLERPKLAAQVGVALGLIIGIGLGSWVAFMAYVVEIELVLAILLFRHARRPLSGLPTFGLALHLAAILSLAPAVLGSPWQSVQPWSVVNLSWFHPFFLGCAALVFVPLLKSGAESPWRRHYPWVVAGVLAVLFSGLFALDAGPGIGLREAFSWASREDGFMASILESASIFDDFERGASQLWLSLGALVVLAPLVVLPAAWLCRKDRLELLPWAVAVPLLLLQTLSQLRFSEALVAPAAVLVAWGVAGILRHLEVRARFGNVLAPFTGLLLGLAFQWPGIAEIERYRGPAAQLAEPTDLQQQMGATRRMCEWLQQQPLVPGAAGVLASWGDGHMIEWVADRPTVATNFGSYLGAASYQFGPRAFLCEQDSKLEAMLQERQIGHLLLNSRMPEMMPDLIQRADPALVTRYLAGVKRGWNGGLRPQWFATAMARMFLAGAPLDLELPPIARKPISFLRLVHVAEELDPKPVLGGLLPRAPRGWVWQYVPGARLQFHGSPGSEVGVDFQLRFPDSQIRVHYVAKARVEEDGLARLRVPYCTDLPNGDARVMAGAVYWIGAGRAPLQIPEAAVTSGSAVDLY